jgi:hypothetical protein
LIFIVAPGTSKQKSSDALQVESESFEMEEVMSPKERAKLSSGKDQLEAEETVGGSCKREGKQAMDEKAIGSCSEERTTDADTDKSNAEDTIVIFVRKKKKVLRKRKRPQKRSSSGNRTTITTTATTSTAEDETSKDGVQANESQSSENLAIFPDSGGGGGGGGLSSEPDKSGPDFAEKSVLDTLDRVKQEAIAMDQPVGADQQVPTAGGALLAQRVDKSSSAGTSGSSKYAAAMARHEVAVHSADSSHDEDDSDIVGVVASGEGASTVTSELGTFHA